MASYQWPPITAGGGGSGITALTGDVTASGTGSVAASLTATTNSTLTTLSSLSLPGSQVSSAVTNSLNTLVTTSSGNANYPVVLAPTSTTGQQSLLMDTDMTYNPSTDVLTLPSGGATSAGMMVMNSYVAYGVSTISAAGSTQGTATPMTTSEVNISSGTTNSGVILPSSPTTNGLTITVTNNTGNTLNVYPPSGGTIDGGATNAAVILPGGQTLALTLFSSGAWYSTGNVIISGGGVAVSHGAGGVTISLNTPVSVTNGGTGNNLNPTQWGVIYASSTTAYGFTPAGTTGQVLTATTGGSPEWAAPATSGTVTSVGVSVPSFLTITSGSPVTASGTIAIGYSGTALPVANGGTGQTSFSSGALSSNGTTISSGTLSVANGGTGTSTAPTQYGVITAASSTAFTSTAAGTANYPLVANSSAAPTFQQLSLTAGVTGTLPIGNGGTGATSLTSGGTGGSASPAIASGTYNPTNEANSGISGISFGTWSWLRVGNVVTVGGTVTVVVGTQAGYSEINLPTTTANFTNSSQASGTLVSNNGITGLVGQIYPVTGTQYVYLQFLSTATSATWFAHFIYQVQ